MMSTEERALWQTAYAVAWANSWQPPSLTGMSWADRRKRAETIADDAVKAYRETYESRIEQKAYSSSGIEIVGDP
jgi:hypothetical protein